MHLIHVRQLGQAPFVRLRFYSLCGQWQIQAEVNWLSGLRSARAAEQKNSGETRIRVEGGVLLGGGESSQKLYSVSEL